MQPALIVLLMALALLGSRPAQAQAAVSAPVAEATAASQPAAEQVIQPQVARREVRRPQYPARDFGVGLYGGVYATENFGSSRVSGLRLSYHITEDIFFDGTLGQSQVSDEAFRQILPGGIFVNRTERLRYYAVSVGYNLLPGEVFFGRNTAKATQGYVLAGIGSTDFAGQKRQTVNYGFGLRLILADWFALQADVRDHVFALDLLGKRKTTHNPEITGGLTVYF
jgi:outer membrane beta-barrel protein